MVKKKRLHRLCAILMATVMVVTGLQPAFAVSYEGQAISSFEDAAPQYAGVVEVGSDLDEVNLPQIVRGLVDLDDVDMSTFKQVEPKADTSDGYVSYDYYWYGYVAPENVAQLYEDNKLVMYTIYCADPESDSEEVAYTEHRLYGSLGEEEPMWYACTAEGQITAAVVDAAVKWSTNNLNLSKEGTYKLKGHCETFTCSEPLEAIITVTAEGTSKHGDDCADCESEDSANTTEPASEEKENVDVTDETELSEKGELAKDCHCGMDGSALPKSNFPWAHKEDCKYFSPVECMCRETKEVQTVHTDEATGEIVESTEVVLGDYAGQHDVNNSECPLYGLDTVEIVKEDHKDETTIISQENAEKIATKEVTYDALGDIEIVKGTEQKGFVYDEDVELLAVSASDGKNSKAMVEYIQTNTPTKDIPDTCDRGGGTFNDGLYQPDKDIDVKVPYAWKEYINTIWMNKAMTSFDWTETALWKWSGTTATVAGGEPSTNPKAIPRMETINKTIDGQPFSSVYVVYSGEQLLYALNALASGDEAKASMTQTIFVAKDIDLNGMEHNWRPVDFAEKRIQVSGYDPATRDETDRTIYNLGSFSVDDGVSGNTDDNKGVGLVHSMSGNLVSENMYYRTAMLTFNKDVGNGSNGESCSLFGYSDLTTDSCRLEDTHIVDSMFYGTEQVSAFGRREYGSSMFRCSTEDCFFYGGNHVTSLATGITPYHYYRNTKYEVTVANKGASNETVTITDKTTNKKVMTLQKAANHKYELNGSSVYVYEGSYGKIEHCYAVGNLLATYGGHSAGFASCYLKDVRIKDSFSAVEMYVTTYSGGFTGLFAGTVDNCFATGKLEGFSHLGGFCCSVQNGTISGDAKYSNCYTTALVGMRSESRHMGGFAATDTVSQRHEKYKENVQHMTFENCYAAGEVGNISTDMSQPENVGGFLNIHDDVAKDFDTLGENLYYDKQTTAMREWQTGEDKNIPKIKGVLTSNTAKAGSGLTNTSPKTATEGFKGFANDSLWDYSEEDHYPELAAFKNATAAQWGNDREAALARAYSSASTSTVMLDTWDTGYDWDGTGVRTENEISYNRAAAEHKGGEYTYDTVRDIISPFTVTETATYTNMVNGGAGANITIHDNSATIGGGAPVNSKEQGAIVINNGTDTGIAENPGMDWFRIEQTDKTDNVMTGYRPIRLVGYMSIEAGDDETISSGDFYNHRPDVRLTMMDTIKDNMVVGFAEHEEQDWSTSVKDGYPRASETTYSDKYYAVPTDRLVTGTNEPTAKNAWLYTEIWKADQNDDGTFAVASSDQKGYYDSALGQNLAAKISVKVTGEGTGDNKTKAEQKWNGDYPFNLESSAAQKYIVSYYWMLKDGRYVTDYKIVTVNPGEYDLNVEVRTYVTGSEDDPSNTESLKLGVATDVNGNPAYALSESTTKQCKVEDVASGTDVSAGIKAGTDNVKIRKTEIKLFGMAYTDKQPQEITNGLGRYEGNLLADLQALKEKGEEAKLPIEVKEINYVYDRLVEETHASTGTKYNREITEAIENQSIIYYAELQDDGTINFSFKKYQDDKNNGDSSLDGVADSVYINDLMCNAKITFWVERDFEFVKTDENDDEFDENDAAFHLYQFDCDKTGVIEGILHKHSGVDGECWNDLGEAKTDANGHVEYKYLPDGEYRLVETATKEGYALPYDGWQVIVDETGIKVTAVDTNKAPAFTVDTDENTTDEIYLTVKNYPVTTIQKKIEGNMADMNKTFDFELGIKKDGTTITLPEDVDGKKTVNYQDFSLGHKETITIPYYIPAGSDLTLEETNLSKYDMTVSYNGTESDPEGAKAELSATAGKDEIVVTNTLNTTPDTGIGLDIMPYILILVVIGAVATVYALRKKSEN